MENTRGSVLMVAAMAAFAMEDMFVKSAAREVSVGLVLMLFGLGGAAVFACLIKGRGQRLLHPALSSAPMLTKLSFEVVGRLGYTLLSPSNPTLCERQFPHYCRLRSSRGKNALCRR